MGMRSRRFFTIFIILLVVLVTVPYVDGFLFKRHYYRFLKSLSASHSIRVNVLEYHQGWFHSTARLSIAFKTGKDKAVQPSSALMVDQTISHGPIVREMGRWTLALGTVDSQMHLPVYFARYLPSVSRMDGLLETHAIAMLNGRYRVQFQMPGLAVHLPSGVNIFWQGMNGKVNLYHNDLQLHKVTAVIQVGAATANMPSGVVPFRLNPSSISLTLDNLNVQGLLRWVVTAATQLDEQVVLNTSSGNALLDAQIVWPVSAKSMKGVIRGARGSANLRIARSLVDQLLNFADEHDAVNNASLSDQLRDEVEKLQKKGMITRDNTDYRVVLTLERGVIRANGREVQRLV